jgi:hypothetical protein
LALFSLAPTMAQETQVPDSTKLNSQAEDLKESLSEATEGLLNE